MFILIFADVLVLLSSTPAGLKNQINCLANLCQKLESEINCSKTKVVVFRKGGFGEKWEKWFLGEMFLEVVNSYVYFGLTFTATMSSFQGTKQLAAKGKFPSPTQSEP